MKNSNWGLLAPNFLFIYDIFGTDSEKMARWKCSNFFTDRVTLFALCNWRKKTHCDKFLKKTQFSQKILFVERWDHFFRIPRVISDQKHPFFDWKKIFLDFLSILSNFLTFFHFFYYNHLLIPIISISPQKDRHPYAQNHWFYFLDI